MTRRAPLLLLALAMAVPVLAGKHPLVREAEREIDDLPDRGLVRVYASNGDLTNIISVAGNVADREITRGIADAVATHLASLPDDERTVLVASEANLGGIYAKQLGDPSRALRHVERAERSLTDAATVKLRVPGAMDAACCLAAVSLARTLDFLSESTADLAEREDRRARARAMTTVFDAHIRGARRIADDDLTGLRPVSSIPTPYAPARLVDIVLSGPPWGSAGGLTSADRLQWHAGNTGVLAEDDRLFLVVGTDLDAVAAVDTLALLPAVDPQRHLQLRRLCCPEGLVSPPSTPAVLPRYLPRELAGDEAPNLDVPGLDPADPATLRASLGPADGAVGVCRTLVRRLVRGPGESPRWYADLGTVSLAVDDLTAGALWMLAYLDAQETALVLSFEVTEVAAVPQPAPLPDLGPVLGTARCRLISACQTSIQGCPMAPDVADRYGLETEPWRPGAVTGWEPPREFAVPIDQESAGRAVAPEVRLDFRAWEARGASPRLVAMTMPVRPDDGAPALLQDEVLLAVEVDRDGSARRVRIIESGSPALTGPALAAAFAASYETYRNDHGETYPRWLILPVSWTTTASGGTSSWDAR